MTGRVSSCDCGHPDAAHDSEWGCADCGCADGRQTSTSGRLRSLDDWSRAYIRRSLWELGGGLLFGIVGVLIAYPLNPSQAGGAVLGGGGVLVGVTVGHFAYRRSHDV